MYLHELSKLRVNYECRFYFMQKAANDKFEANVAKYW